MKTGGERKGKCAVVLGKNIALFSPMNCYQILNYFSSKNKVLECGISSFPPVHPKGGEVYLLWAQNKGDWVTDECESWGKQTGPKKLPFDDQILH